MTRTKKWGLICLAFNLIPIFWAVIVIITSYCGITISNDMYLTIKFMPTIFVLTNNGLLDIFAIYSLVIWMFYAAWYSSLKITKKKG